MTAARRHDTTLFFNRELSWLAFNERVLEQAADTKTPLLERVKFAAIAASNLDEFVMVRVAGLKEAIDDGDTAPDLAGLTPAQQLKAVSERAHALVDRMYSIVLGQLLPALDKHDVKLMKPSALTDRQRAALGSYFRDSILPILTPLAIDVARPFPLLSSLSINVAVLLAPARGDTETRLAIAQVPPGLTRLVPVSDTPGTAFVLLEEVIRMHLSQLFPGQQILETSMIRLARDAELEFDDEGGRTHLDQVERELRHRRHSDVVRLEIEEGASSELVSLLCRQTAVTESDVYAVRGPLDLRMLMGLTDLPGFDDLRDPPLQPVNLLEDLPSDIFAAINEHDLLLHHPYDGYEPVLALLAQAADDPDVLAIKQTLYRASPASQLIASLRHAAECNKQVTVVVELTARFDEERNIQWARQLEEAGAHVIYGIRGYKVHAKLCLIVRRTPGGLRRYVHLGTGNYNERTAKIYTDFGILTANQAIAEDASAFFSALTGYSDPPRLKKLVMAPTGLRERLLKLIGRERRRADAGQPAEITAKMNSLIDDEIIEALYEASRAGVTVRLNVRGICALRPGVSGHSENIQVVSVVDRFLEHSRVFAFLNGGDEEVYLSSADWMTRNFDRRIELMFPVEDAAHRARVLTALRAMFRDNVKSRWLGSDGVYRPRPSSGEPRYRVQEALQADARRAASLAREAAGVVFRPEQRERRA